MTTRFLPFPPLRRTSAAARPRARATSTVIGKRLAWPRTPSVPKSLRVTLTFLPPKTRQFRVSLGKKQALPCATKIYPLILGLHTLPSTCGLREGVTRMHWVLLVLCGLMSCFPCFAEEACEAPSVQDFAS